MAILTLIVATLLWGGAFTAGEAAVLACTFCYYRGLSAVGAARSGVFLPLVPVCGLILRVLFLGQRPRPWLIVGGVMLLAGGRVAVRGPAGPSGPDPQGGAGR